MDENKRIIGSEALTPYLFNIPKEYVERFRRQITVIDLLNEGSPEVLREAVWSCFQEEPTPFRDYELYDPGAYPEPPISGKITWRVTQPQREPKTEEERSQAGKAQALSDRIKKALEERRRRARGVSREAPEEEEQGG
jgi:tetrahydromethanopterin S-methyltransferase subunit A